MDTVFEKLDSLSGIADNSFVYGKSEQEHDQQVVYLEAVKYHRFEIINKPPLGPRGGLFYDLKTVVPEPPPDILLRTTLSIYSNKPSCGVRSGYFTKSN